MRISCCVACESLSEVYCRSGPLPSANALNSNGALRSQFTYTQTLQHLPCPCSSCDMQPQSNTLPPPLTRPRCPAPADRQHMHRGVVHVHTTVHEHERDKHRNFETVDLHCRNQHPTHGLAHGIPAFCRIRQRVQYACVIYRACRIKILTRI